MAAKLTPREESFIGMLLSVSGRVRTDDLSSIPEGDRAAMLSAYAQTHVSPVPLHFDGEVLSYSVAETPVAAAAEPTIESSPVFDAYVAPLDVPVEPAPAPVMPAPPAPAEPMPMAAPVEPIPMPAPTAAPEPELPSWVFDDAPALVIEPGSDLAGLAQEIAGGAAVEPVFVPESTMPAFTEPAPTSTPVPMPAPADGGAPMSAAPDVGMSMPTVEDSAFFSDAAMPLAQEPLEHAPWWWWLVALIWPVGGIVGFVVVGRTDPRTARYLLVFTVAIGLLLGGAIAALAVLGFM